MPRRLRPVSLAAFVLALVAGVAGEAPTSRPARAADPSCIEVVNHTPYWMPGVARARGTREIAFRLAAGESSRFCLDGEAARVMAIEVVIKSGWGLPIGSCRLYDGGRMEIDRQKTDSGERTRLNCR